MHREILEMKGQPYRLYRAREKKHGHKYKNIYRVIAYEQSHRFLEAHGTMRGMTKEKLDGTYERNPKLNDEAYCEVELDKWMCIVIEEFMGIHNDLFQFYPDLADRLIKDFFNLKTLLDWPKVLFGLFEGKEIPAVIKDDERFPKL